MKTFLIVLCIAIVLIFLAFQAALAMFSLAFTLGKILAVAAGVYLLIRFLQYYFKKRTT